MGERKLKELHYQIRNRIPPKIGKILETETKTEAFEYEGVSYQTVTHSIQHFAQELLNPFK